MGTISGPMMHRKVPILTETNVIKSISKYSLSRIYLYILQIDDECPPKTFHEILFLGKLGRDNVAENIGCRS